MPSCRPTIHRAGCSSNGRCFSGCCPGPNHTHRTGPVHAASSGLIGTVCWPRTLSCNLCRPSTWTGLPISRRGLRWRPILPILPTRLVSAFATDVVGSRLHGSMMAARIGSSSPLQTATIVAGLLFSRSASPSLGIPISPASSMPTTTPMSVPPKAMPADGSSSSASEIPALNSPRACCPGRGRLRWHHPRRRKSRWSQNRWSAFGRVTSSHLRTAISAAAAPLSTRRSKKSLPPARACGSRSSRQPTARSCMSPPMM